MAGENAETANPNLHPLYKPPEMDSMLQIRFIGNTAQIGDYNFRACDPYQLLVAAHELERIANQQISMAERRAAAEGIVVAQAESPPAGKILTPEDLKG